MDTTEQNAVGHTPGPWVASKGPTPYDDDEHRWSVVRAAQPNYLVAIIENGAPGDTLETEGCTAHLIAAAPDLLRACEEARTFIINHGPQTSDALAEIDDLDAAIAKATRKAGPK